MKYAVTSARILVGLLFIFSGLVKANDPLGLSYKMQEFFDLWGMSKLDAMTLPLSVAMNMFEILAGFALLIGWGIRVFSWLLLLLIVFFSFLTGYAFFSGKFTNCGCFGDCIPLTPKTSFIKDLILLTLIIFLFIKQKMIRPVFSIPAAIINIGAVALCSFFIQWYALRHLPYLDCLPFKVGNSIPEKMKIPVNALPDSFAIRFVYQKNGKQYEFAPETLPANLETYQFVSRSDKLIRKGNAEPAIKGFVLNGMTNADSTQIILDQPQCLLLFYSDFSSPVSKWEKGFNELYAEAKSKNVPVYLVTSNPEQLPAHIDNTSLSALQVMKCDFTAVRTAARVNPCLYLLNKGTIMGKWSRYRWKQVLRMMNKN
jgi:uncharacterized membrane protein YphA (DoxX/SURF4 family)